jgi:hypothetical protein
VLALCVCATAASGQAGDRVVTKDDVTTRVVVRATPTAASADRGTLRPGESAELLGSVPNWYEVRLSNGIESVTHRATRTTIESHSARW